MNDPSAINRASLLTKVAAGDAEAARQCIHRYGTLVWTLTRRMSSSWNSAEQTVQQVFQEIWRQAVYYQPALLSEETFIVTVTRRCLIERLKQTDWRPSPPRRTEQRESRDRNVPPADMAADIVSVTQKLAQFTPEQQQILAWGILYGHPYEKIADILGLPMETVKVQMRNSLLQIREAMTSAHAKVEGRTG